MKTQLQTMLTDLVSAGFSQKRIGLIVNLSQPAICDLLSGKAKSTKLEQGQRIIALHKSLKRNAQVKL